MRRSKEKISQNKILIVKIQAIGDIVMALPLLNTIDEIYPGAQISWLCGKIVEPLLKEFKRIDSLIVIDEYKLLTGNILSKLRVIIKLWTKLFLKKYDLILTLYKDRRYKLLTLSAFRSKKLFLGDEKGDKALVPGRYHTIEFIRLLSKTNDYQIKEPTYPKLNITLSEKLRPALSTAKTKIILTPGGAQNLINGGQLRRWGIDNYAELAERFYSEGFEIYLVGASSDEWALKYFKNVPVINLIGKTTLTDVISVYSACDLLVSHDTGLMHLAKLTNIKTIALFGPVNPKERVGNNENIFTIWKGEHLYCSPCYNGKSFPDCSNNICMKNISTEEVFSFAINLLTKK